MKINFKKLAMSAGVTAAMAAGSMSAHAVITAVPAPAQLVPLFYFNVTPGNSWDTDVRITVPKAVGTDSVINLLGGNRNGLTNIAVDTSWDTDTAAFKPTVAGGDTILANEIHWFWMNNRSEEISNGKITVTPDDSVWLSAEEVASRAQNLSGVAGYLILSNQSAFNGGAPQFSFAADAWVENEDNVGGFPNAFSIPVLGLADDVDQTQFPTPTNNLIQNYPASARGPIASPIHTGIRTSSTAGFPFRVVDLPIHDNGNRREAGHTNTLVAWVDSNAPLTGDKAGLGNGASGRLFGIGPDEEFSSLGSISLPNQVNIVTLGEPNPYTGDLGRSVNGTTVTSTMGLNNCNGTCSGRAANPVQVNSIAFLGEAQDGGFLKFVFDTKPLPAGTLTPGSYSSMIMFNVPGLLQNAGWDVDAPNMGIDTGFFSQN